LKKKVLKLKDKPEYDFLVIAISSHDKDYRLSWSINETLEIELVKNDNLIVKHKRMDAEQQFSRFSYLADDEFTAFHLISNRSEQGYLIKNLMNIDYFLKIEGLPTINKNNVIQKIKTLEPVITAFEIDISNLKEKDKLLF
jgi:hypothetical protein